ncbi:hypothetical protein MY4824_006306 [Beauveria thailandica]
MIAQQLGGRVAEKCFDAGSQFGFLIEIEVPQDDRTEGREDVGYREFWYEYEEKMFTKTALLDDWDGGFHRSQSMLASAIHLYSTRNVSSGNTAGG